jgi:ERCC4-type nuclease
MILVSPTEPPLLRSIGRTSSLPEERGADYLLPSAAGSLVAVQRKTVDDLVSSVADGRLEREVVLLRRQMSILLLEGLPDWTSNGTLLSRRRWTKAQHYGLLLSLQLEFGIPVLSTPSITDTADLIHCLESWLRKPVHLSLLRRPTANQSSEWGTATDRDWGRHLLQSFPGVGVVLADAILDTFGRVPLAWTCSYPEFLTVPGIGERRARALWQSLGGEPPASRRRAQGRRTG